MIILGVLFLIAIVLLGLIVKENMGRLRRDMNTNIRYKTRLGSDFNIYDDEY